MKTDLTLASATGPDESGPTTATLAAGQLFDASLAHARGTLLQAYLNLFDELLRADLSLKRADRLHLITLRYELKMRQEAEELAANPALAQDRLIAAERFARKAQSGFSPHPLPE